ncbi:MAG: DEAD/DEAH box helicase family protein [Bacteroidales bacterium]|nr:DEAD/DEAH box helicase family protein [Bacteroidales bacterium]
MTYHEKYGSKLRKVIAEYNARRLERDMFSTSDYAIFNSIESGITKHYLRYYQMEALYILDHILRLPQDKPERKELVDIVDKESGLSCPYIGYEMATGSGKTMLMGAAVYFLNQKFGIDNFLIITPSSTDIYYKSIRNFTIGNYDSVWADDTPFTFNLITGDNYTQNLFFDHSKEANIFLFNISKFGANATNTEKTWESAVWKDVEGNNISIKQYLQDKKLVIITDEAHHAQSLVARKIISNFRPSIVLEFTATAEEGERNLERRNQTIVYKYDIRRFLEDGHGKLVRAVALSGEDRQDRNDLSSSEKLKIITLFIIHLLKKEAVLLDPKTKGLKPIAFVKVKNDTVFTEKVFNYIRNDLANDVENLKVIVKKVEQHDLEITNLLQSLYESKYTGKIDKLREDIRLSAQTTIFYHGKSDKETEKKWENIRKNEVEIIVYMQRLDEGIDLPNIYSMAVVHDSISNFKTSVKQIIGRGVRLNKDKREFDDEQDQLRAQAEKLHVICDQGRNFEEVIEEIQHEFGLSDKYLSIDKEKKKIINNVKSELLDGIYIPHIKADYIVKRDANLLGLVNDVDTIISDYHRDNCFPGKDNESLKFIKYKPTSFFVEVDVFADKQEYHKQLMQAGGHPTLLELDKNDTKIIYGMVSKTLYCLPDSQNIKNIFQTYIDKLNAIGLWYYKIDEADPILARKFFYSNFSFYYRNHIESNYFTIDFKVLSDEDSWNLKQNFKDLPLILPEDQINNNKRKEKEKQKVIDLINKNYYFHGYEKSVYEYDKFDSFIEKSLADYINEVLKAPRKPLANIAEPEPAFAAEPEITYKVKNKPNFWVRNNRNIYFTYGSRRYYPDFIMIKDDKVYVLEAKGEIFSDTKKNLLLKRLDDVPGFKSLIIFSQQIEEMGSHPLNFDEFEARAEEILYKRQTADQLIPDPPSNEKYVSYLPVYSPANAFKKFIKGNSSAKSEGWLKVERNPDTYPITVFATQVKGSALFPEYEHNDWIILNSRFERNEAIGKLCLVIHTEINDEYEGNATVRRLKIELETNPKSLFPEKKIVLDASNVTFSSIIIQVSDERNLDIIGIVK